jgi:alginate O-acetyltransferase complex protein AlgI
MRFSTSIFLFAFLPTILFVYYVLLRSRKWRNYFLLLSSLLFYAWGEPWFVFVMIASIIGNWFFGLHVDRYRDHVAARRLILTAMVAFNLGIMFVFKYLMFTLSNMNLLFGTHLLIPVIELPIGISFFTFQAMSYVIDIYRKHGKVQRNPLNVGLYIALFPQLIAGPIVRYETVADQISHRKENFDDFSIGVCRFLVGLFKKVLLANTLAIVADKAFSMPNNELSVAFAWLGIIAYTFQIYYDFSGYSDMAIGLGRMFGFHFLENFDHPYASRSVSEFWRKWHMSLSSWFRDYVFIPIGGSRVKTKSRLVFNLFVVWFLTGVWHGANWTFICWGMFYFFLLTGEKLTGFDERIKKGIAVSLPSQIVRHVYVILAFMFGWVLFRAENLSHALAYFGSMFALSGNPLFDDLAHFYFMENRYLFLAAAIFSMPIVKYCTPWFERSRWRIAYPAVFVLMFLVCIGYIAKGSYNPFIYFNF